MTPSVLRLVARSHTRPRRPVPRCIMQLKIGRPLGPPSATPELDVGFAPGRTQPGYLEFAGWGQLSASCNPKLHGRLHSTCRIAAMWQECLADPIAPHPQLPPSHLQHPGMQSGRSSAARTSTPRYYTLLIHTRCVLSRPPPTCGTPACSCQMQSGRSCSGTHSLSPTMRRGPRAAAEGPALRMVTRMDCTAAGGRGQGGRGAGGREQGSNNRKKRKQANGIQEQQGNLYVLPEGRCRTESCGF